MSKIVLLIGVADDPVLIYVAKILTELNSQLVWLDQNAMGKSLLCNSTGWQFYKKQAIVWQIKHIDVVGVYSRLAGLNYKIASPKQIVTYESLIYLLNTVYPQVVNRPNNNLSNFSKLSQLVQLANCGLVIPDSCLQVFNKNKLQSYVFKSASSYRSIVKLNAGKSAEGIEPVLYQKFLAGINYRVHVFLDVCCSVKVATEAIDYRYCNASKFVSCDIPQDLKKICIQINKDLGLIFSGIDLINYKNRWYLLEVNPAPGFNFFVFKTNDEVLVNEITQFFKRLCA